MDNAIRPLVILCVLVYAGIGLWTVIDPLSALAPLGVVALDDRGVVELRAMYGGLELGMAAFLTWTLATDQARAGLMAGTLTIGGLGLVRTAAWLALMPEGLLLPGLCLIELSGGLVGAFVLWKSQPK